MIYVDDCKNKFHNMVMSHMTADSSEELMIFATTVLKLKPEWVQCRGTWKEHFDVSQTKRKMAIENGAIAMNRIDYIRMVKKKKR
ncbi:MAG: DUF4031 domain-containing protein [Cyanobacteria bacterium P01_H01_bin.35]